MKRSISEPWEVPTFRGHRNIHSCNRYEHLIRVSPTPHAEGVSVSMMSNKGDREGA